MQLRGLRRVPARLRSHLRGMRGLLGGLRGSNAPAARVIARAARASRPACARSSAGCAGYFDVVRELLGGVTIRTRRLREQMRQLPGQFGRLRG
jgi:hypothetical protein